MGQAALGSYHTDDRRVLAPLNLEEDRIELAAENGHSEAKLPAKDHWTHNSSLCDGAKLPSSNQTQDVPLKRETELYWSPVFCNN